MYDHIIATLPGMWERTVTFGSAGKAFSATGAKVNLNFYFGKRFNNIILILNLV